MKNSANPLLLSFALSLLAAGAVGAQTSGHIQYEATQRTDISQMHVVINGQVVKPGSPDFPTDIPDSRSFGLTLTFAGNFAKEEHEGNGMVMRTMEGGPNGAPQTRSISSPFEDATYLDLAGRATISVLTVKKDNTATSYRSEAPIAAPAGWTLNSQTRKIAGYTCHKATVPLHKETYTVWFTTDLPFTYSPVRELTPAKGVVLALESEQEQYQATKVDLKAVADADVMPGAGAQKVTAAELKDLREKAMATFRQQMMEGETRSSRN